MLVARPARYQETIEEGIEAVMREVVLPHDAPGGMPEYRQVLAGSLLFKAFLEISNNITGRVTEDIPGIGKPLDFKLVSKIQIWMIPLQFTLSNHLSYTMWVRVKTTLWVSL